VLVGCWGMGGRVGRCFVDVVGGGGGGGGDISKTKVKKYVSKNIGCNVLVVG